MEWKTSKEPVEYEDVLKQMEARVAAIHAGQAEELVWLLEHPPLYTAGTSAKESDLLDPRFPVYETGRGGQYTYHGPGQRVTYVMLDLKKHQQHPDIKQYIYNLEAWIIRSLAAFDIQGERREGRIGIWVNGSEGEKKIAAIGVRIRHWITFHGISLNVSPDLSHYDGIVPCGISDAGVTSMAELLDRDVAMAELDEALKAAWPDIFEEQEKAA